MRVTRRVIVTGASRGIGRACAFKLATSGFDVCVHYHAREDLAAQVVEHIKAARGSASLLQFDVSQRQQVAAALARDIDRHGAYYGAVCNAGIAVDKAFPALGGEDWDRVIHTNLDAFYNVLNPLIMPMIKLRQGGRIVCLSSVSGLVGNRGQTNYSAAKAGIIGAAKALAMELAKRNITVNCVAPGVIDTEMTENMYRDEAMKLIPMRRFGKVEEVAATVDFLLSDNAAYITRQVISVNGGMC